MEDLIKQLGLQFRNIVQHSDGRWSCKLMHRFKGREEFWADSPTQALQEAVDWLEHFED